jgi:dehydrogenase/reductase SDR family member 7B
MNHFTNKIIWITGASSGIGKQLALQLNALGAQVIISSRKHEELEAVKNACAHPNKTHVEPIDLTNISSFNSITEKLVSKFGKIDILINNGGISQRSLASETSLDIDRKLMEVNYFGNIALTKALLPYLQKQQAGHIVVISSLSGKFGFFLRSAYSASKHALVGFYESLRLEEEKNNIHVSLVFPGLINTDISKNALTKEGQPHGKLDDKQANGISAELCAQQIIKGIERQHHDIFTGGKELKAVWIKRFFPSLFYKIIRKQKPD